MVTSSLLNLFVLETVIDSDVIDLTDETFWIKNETYCDNDKTETCEFISFIFCCILIRMSLYFTLRKIPKWHR